MKLTLYQVLSRFNRIRVGKIMAEHIVQVNEGSLKGEARLTSNKKQFYAFKGIPYAKPPVGDLRFAIPEPAASWEGVKDATKDCNICCQYDQATNTVNGDEDCLYLNVYTPNLSTSGTAPLPVMVFMHGGGFVYGSGTDDKVHGPDFIVEKDIVIVSLNYRLGIFGFLSLDRKEAPGNMGLRDQVLALKWIQNNIAKFNGDPKNVTIFGISAGGASVEYLLLSPMAKGLFHKALAQSGSSLLHWAYNNDVKKLAQRIAETAGAKIDDNEGLYQFLKGMPAKELTIASMKALQMYSTLNMKFGYVPTVEKPGDWEPFLSESPYKLLKNGEFTKVPYASGFTSHEGLLMAGMRKETFDAFVKEKNFVKSLPFNIEEGARSEIETQFKAAYMDANNSSDDFAVDFYSDIDFSGGIYVAASLIAKNNSPVYFYEFAYDGGLNYLKNKLNIKRKGACHGDDGGYLIKAEGNVEISETDKLVKERMVTMWTNFAKYGNPTPEKDSVISTKWEPIANENFQYLRIDDQLNMKEKPYPLRMKLYEQLYEKYNCN